MAPAFDEVSAPTGGQVFSVMDLCAELSLLVLIPLGGQMLAASPERDLLMAQEPHSSGSTQLIEAVERDSLMSTQQVK